LKDDLSHTEAAPVRDQARFLRRNASEAERRLWSRLRNHGLGVKFRRQHPIGATSSISFAVRRGW